MQITVFLGVNRTANYLLVANALDLSVLLQYAEGLKMAL